MCNRRHNANGLEDGKQREAHYYEDDLCPRIRATGRAFALCNEVTVHHAGQRASYRDFAYPRRHMASFLRHCLKYPGLATGLRSARPAARALRR